MRAQERASVANGSTSKRPALEPAATDARRATSWLPTNVVRSAPDPANAASLSASTSATDERGSDSETRAPRSAQKSGKWNVLERPKGPR